MNEAKGKTKKWKRFDLFKIGYSTIVQTQSSFSIFPNKMTAKT